MKRLSSEQRSRMVLVLVMARSRIRSGASPYVCHALGSALKNLSIDYVADVEYLRKWIDLLLDGQITLSLWLHSKHGIEISLDKSYRDKMKRTRLVWLDWMINELEHGK